MFHVTTDSSSALALKLKLKRGSRQSGGLEILDAKSNKPVALILEGEHAEALAQLLVASPDLLYAISRARDHLRETTGHTHPLRNLLREVWEKATRALK